MDAPETEFLIEEDAPVFKPPKKGRASWSFDDPLAIPAQWKDPRLTYRYVLNEPRQIRRRQAQGFVLANQSNGVGENFQPSKGTSIEGAPIAGGDLVLMAAHKEVAESYREHLDKQTDSVVRAITREVRDDAPVDERTGRRAEVRQRLVIE